MGWLYTQGNKIYQSNGTVWAGRGVNIPDSYLCQSCTSPSQPSEVTRRIKELVEVWGATFIRMTLEKDQESTTPAVSDFATGSAHLQDTVDIVNFVGNYKNVDDTPAVYIMLNLYYDDPSIDHANGNLPTCAAAAVWEAIVKAFASTPHVIFSITNEPFYPSSSSVGDAFSGTDLEWSANVWEAMNTFVGVIRTAEAAAGATNPHLIAVQGMANYGRWLDYYYGGSGLVPDGNDEVWGDGTQHLITAAGGHNVVYEVHTYDVQAWWQRLVFDPAAVLPVIVGELAPAQSTATEADEVAQTVTLMQTLEAMQIPYAAWVFDEKCNSAGSDPGLLNMLQRVPGYSGCTVGMPLIASAPWGTAVQAQLQPAPGTAPPVPTSMPVVVASPVPTPAQGPMPVPTPAPGPSPSLTPSPASSPTQTPTAVAPSSVRTSAVAPSPQPMVMPAPLPQPAPLPVPSTLPAPVPAPSQVPVPAPSPAPIVMPASSLLPGKAPVVATAPVLAPAPVPSSSNAPAPSSVPNETPALAPDTFATPALAAAPSAAAMSAALSCLATVLCIVTTSLCVCFSRQ